MSKKLVLSALPKTWFIDIDGVVFIHNGYLNGEDTLVEGFMDFYNQIGNEDKIIFVSARKEELRGVTEKAFKKHGIRYDMIILEVPVGERVLINDEKPQGLKTSVSINTKRDIFPPINIVLDENL